MSYSNTNGREPEIRLIRAEAVVEVEMNADGRPGRWRRMAVTVPLLKTGGITSAVTLDIDLTEGEAPAPAPETWTAVIGRMGSANQGEHHEE